MTALRAIVTLSLLVGCGAVSGTVTELASATPGPVFEKRCRLQCAVRVTTERVPSAISGDRAWPDVWATRLVFAVVEPNAMRFATLRVENGGGNKGAEDRLPSILDVTVEGKSLFVVAMFPSTYSVSVLILPLGPKIVESECGQDALVALGVPLGAGKQKACNISAGLICGAAGDGTMIVKLLDVADPGRLRVLQYRLGWRGGAPNFHFVGFSDDVQDFRLGTPGSEKRSGQ